ncbi:DUF2914 domain-containing protein [Colwellia sp. RE-S-Sl-9]
MQLKIKINVSKEPISPPEPAPFDPVKIRNFLLLLITLFSLIGFGVYSLWTKKSEPSSPSTLNTPNNVLSSKTVVNDTDSNNNNVNTAESNSTTINTKTFASSTLTEDTIANTVDSTTANAAMNTTSHTVRDTATNVMHTELLKNNITSNEAVTQTKTTIAITSDASAQETDKTEPELVAETKPEIKTQSPVNVTPKTVNNVEQKEADLLAPTQAINNGVYRAQLTSNILSREPSDNIQHLSLQEQNKLYFFTEIHGKNNQKIYHRWIFKKKRLAEITLNISNEQWRTYSSKNFDETMVGQWEVQVVDQNDNILKTVMFEVSR